MPEFASQDYWNERFQKNTAPHDWLIPARSLREFATHWIPEEDLKQSEILHIGCGTSDSLHLRDLVANPNQIHNVDFSQIAIDAGSAREKESLNQDNVEASLVEVEKNQTEHESTSSNPSQQMRWSQIDLLSIPQIFDLMEEQASRDRFFTLILDKSTSDSIACGHPFPLELPYPLSVNGWTHGILQSDMTQIHKIHPLHLLAVHMAALTMPGTGRWIAVSYSEDRFPFLPPWPRSVEVGLLGDEVVRAGFPHPGSLWRLIAKERIEFEVRKGLGGDAVHRPAVAHWLYVLERTAVVVM